MADAPPPSLTPAEAVEALALYRRLKQLRQSSVVWALVNTDDLSVRTVGPRVDLNVNHATLTTTA